MTGLTVFLLAHPDDEVLFWPLIARTPSEQLALLYVTDGRAGGGCKPETRAEETRRMLSELGREPTRAHFVGQKHALPDGNLYRHLDRAWSAIKQWVEQAGPVSRICTHAWEGGHQDHDVCHALSVALAQITGPDKVAQVACYRRPDLGPMPYSLLDPIAANGATGDIRMTAGERLAMAGCVVRYPSQWKSWVGLGPPLLTRLAAQSTYPVQPIDAARLSERPHAGRLLYETRGGPAFGEVQNAVGHFLRP